MENDCILLRPLQAEDCGNLLEFAINEPDLWKFSWLQPVGKDNLERYINVALEARSAGKEYPFIVFDKRTREYAGSTRFYDIQLSYLAVQLGYTWYGSRFQGTGLNRNCKFLLLQFAFEQIGMERVEFRADNNNSRSIAAMKSIGCIEEGVLRSQMPKANGGRRDSIVLSILKTEWESTVRQKLLQRI